MMELMVNDMLHGYRDVLRTILLLGTDTAPRGLGTCEVLNASIMLSNPRHSLPTGIGRNLNTKIAAVESLQLLGGVLHPERMLKASPAFKAFMDGGTFHGGYGQRTRAQLPVAVQRLRDDAHSRRAIITMWDPLHDLFTEGAHDYPCTIALQFLVRDGELLLHTHMRSNDAWRGLAYDVFVFTQLQLVVAASLSLPPGPYTHHATSLHIYDTDLDAVEALLARDDTPIEPISYPSLITDGTSIPRAMSIARMLLEGEPPSRGHNYRNDVNPLMYEWYRERVK